MANPRFGGDDLLPLSRSCGKEASPLSHQKEETSTIDQVEQLSRTMESCTIINPLEHTVASSESTGDSMHKGVNVRLYTRPDSADGEANPKEPLPDNQDVQEVMDVLQKLGIDCATERHRLKGERGEDNRELRHRTDGVYCKNLLLKDKKGKAYLVICHEDDSADLKVVKYHVNAQGNVYFASPDSLFKLLRVLPGAVTPLALYHPASRWVNVYMDVSLIERVDRDVTRLYFHPLRSDLQVGLTLSELERFLAHCGVPLHKLPSLSSYIAGRRFYLYERGRGKDRPSSFMKRKLPTSAVVRDPESKGPRAHDGRSGPVGVLLPGEPMEEDHLEVDQEISHRVQQSTRQATDTTESSREPEAETTCHSILPTENDRETEGEYSVTALSEISLCTVTSDATSTVCKTWHAIQIKLNEFRVQTELIKADKRGGEATPAFMNPLLRRTEIRCKSVFMKDKRENHFIFVCHELQKVDFSNLKMHLKPRKKITPLGPDELWSLSEIREGFESPFFLTQINPLAHAATGAVNSTGDCMHKGVNYIGGCMQSKVKQPRFLVAVAENLYTEKNSSLLFPHPSDRNMRVKVSLQELETLVGRAGHDLVTIPVKGTIQSMDELHAAISVTTNQNPGATGRQTNPIRLLPPNDAEPNLLHKPRFSEVTADQPLSNASDINVNAEDRFGSNNRLHLPGPSYRDRDIFYQMTFTLRSWFQSVFSWLTRGINAYLPGYIQSLLARYLTNTSETDSDSYNSHAERPADLGIRRLNNEKETKIAKLKTLIQKAGIHIEIVEIPEQGNIHQPARSTTSTVNINALVFTLKSTGGCKHKGVNSDPGNSTPDDAETCKLMMLLDVHNRPYFVVCTEDLYTEIPRHVQTLQRAFMSPSPLALASSKDIANVMKWTEEGATVSWTEEELSPLVLLELDSQVHGRVRVGITGALYSFPDTPIKFDLPALGVTLSMNGDDLERLVRRCGFRTVYLP